MVVGGRILSESEAGWKEWTRSQILYGLILPFLVGVLILAWPLIMKSLVGGPETVLGGILTIGLAQGISIGIPVFLGLTWNRWAGGASGFLLGTLYYLAVTGYYNITGAAVDVSWIAYIVGPIVAGYIAGAMIGESFKLVRILIVAIVAALADAALLIWTYDLIHHVFAGFPGGQPYDLVGLQVPLWFYVTFINMTPPLIFSIFAAIFAKIFSWYALSPRLLKQYQY